MALTEFDQFVKSSPEYLPYLEIPDFSNTPWIKETRQIIMTIFANQPLIQVWNIRSNFKASSYLFNPETNFKGLLLPDLDIVEVIWTRQALEAIKKIRDFYESFWWTTWIYKIKIKKSELIYPKRCPSGIWVMDPTDLFNLAWDIINWNNQQLYFNK